jgi:hypothetical protein
MTNNTAQPIPDTEGEWRVEAMPTHGWRVVDATGQEIVADVYREEDAAQIVADHKAAKSQALLVEALRESKSLLTSQDELARVIAEPKVLGVIRAALKAAGVEEK